MTNGQYWFLKKLLIVWGWYRLVSFLSLNAFAIIILLVSKGLCCYCRLGWVSSRKSCINRPDPDSEPNLAKERGGGEGGHQGGQEHHLHPHRCAVACPVHENAIEKPSSAVEDRAHRSDKRQEMIVRDKALAERFVEAGHRLSDQDGTEPGHPQHVELFSLERLFWSHKRFPVNLIKKIFLCSVLLREFVVFIFISNFHSHFLNSLLLLILFILLLYL